MASLVDQIFAQAQLGTAPDPNANPYATGVQLGQNQQRINLEKQRLAMEVAQMPLQQTLQRQATEMNALKIQDALQERQNYLSSTGAFTNLASQVSPLLETGKLDEAQRLVIGSGLSNNFLLTDPRYKAMVSQLDNMRKEADILQYRTAQSDAAMVRAEAAQARAETASKGLELGEAKQELAKAKEARLREQFDYQVRKFETTVPADKLAIFRERAKSIQNDLSLISDAAKRDQKLQELANELKLGASAAPAASGGFKVRVIKP